jgi:thiamine biosynthesis protein ThiS
MNAPEADAMTVKLTLRDQEYEVRAGMTLLSALEKLSISPETVLATRDGELITEDEILQDGDHIRLVAVISGG